ncbi:hypothetical protein CHS0354_006660, partial [Potamilus streckersoni]
MSGKIDRHVLEVRAWKNKGPGLFEVLHSTIYTLRITSYKTKVDKNLKDANRTRHLFEKKDKNEDPDLPAHGGQRLQSVEFGQNQDYR